MLRFVPAVIAIVVIEIGIAALFGGRSVDLLVAFIVGFAVAAPVFLWIAEPGHVRHWGMGAEGEVATDAELRKLGAGWSWHNGTELGRSDIDHLVSGPTGTYVLETKHLVGKVSVTDSELTRTHEELPDRPERWAWVRGATISKAIEASRWSIDGRGRREFVRAVVVIWGDFEQGGRREREHHVRPWISPR